MDKLEKFIFSKKHLPSIVYFGSLTVIIIDIYCNEFTPSFLETLFFGWFLYLTGISIKNLNKKKK